MIVSKTEVLTNIAARIEELDALARMMPDRSLAADLHRISGLLHAVLTLISDLPEAFDETSPWWPEWSAARALLRSGPKAPPSSDG